MSSLHLPILEKELFDEREIGFSSLLWNLTRWKGSGLEGRPAEGAGVDELERDE